jgi:hypothetical protein
MSITARKNSYLNEKTGLFLNQIRLARLTLQGKVNCSAFP